MPPPPSRPDAHDEGDGDGDDRPRADLAADPDALTPAQLHAALATAIDADEARARTRARSLARELDRLIADAQATPPDDEHDPDGATVGFERAQLTHLLRDAERHLAALAEARERLAAGTVATCAVCGDPIPAARRLARPVSDRCVGCAASRGR